MTRTPSPKYPDPALERDLPSHRRTPGQPEAPCRMHLERRSSITVHGGVASNADDTDGMGFDPQRPQRRRPSDVIYVGAAVVVAVVLIAWALFL